MKGATVERPTTEAMLILNVTKWDADGEEPGFWLLTRGGVIEHTGTGNSWVEWGSGVTTIDGTGAYLTPGFIDLHFHGGGGHSNEDGPEAIKAAVATHCEHGTTRAVVSLVANPLETLLDSVASIASLADEDQSILGSHLEGPFLAADRRGAHHPAHLIDPTAANVQDILRAARGTLRQITIDPGRTDALAAISTFADAGVTVAIGHTSADYDLAVAAFRAGARLLTHTFNAMPGIHHREPGPVVAALDTPGVFFELILDGTHVHPRVAAHLMGAAPHRVALITDAMAASGSADGAYVLGTVGVEVSQGTATLAGTSVLAGSTLTLDKALRMGLKAGIDRVAMIEALTLTPARILGLDAQLGLLKPGYLADLVLLGSDLTVLEVFVGGPVRSAATA
ncbi:MAG TPA: N-acetylglucosamine-6-phosphate deacetylase [Glaciibacter sp.]|nr:N-acetylglucosamine-6-phosphate deacetylase [Glaciibacter sp.]